MSIPPGTVDILECTITDDFVLSLKDAELHRTIIYKNSTKEVFPIEIKLKKFLYHYNCEDFRIEINGVVKPFLLQPNNYVSQLTIDSGLETLNPGGELAIKISCRWRDFYNFLSDLYFTFQYEDVAKYSLSIKNYSLENTMYSVTVNGKEPILNKEYFIQHNSVIFNKTSISPNQEFCLRLYSIATPSDLGVISMIKENNGGKIFENSVVLIIQHLLSDSVHLVNAFCDGGADKNAIFIVGIPYSTKYSTIKYLKNKGFNNIVSPEQYPFETEVEGVMGQAIDYAEKSNKKIVVVEDGGYVVPLLHQKFLAKAHLFDGAVEQTANGIWRDKEIEVTHKIPFSIPIINVADSRIKDQLESPLIGRAVSKNIELIYNKTFRGLAGERVGIIGFGRTGKKVAEDLKFHGSIVKVYDKDPINQSTAKGAGFELLASVSEVVKVSKIVIECTGRTWEDDKAATERMNILLNFQHGSFFVSASSKRMGIDYVEFAKVIEKAKTLNIPGLGVRYKLRNNNDVTLVANGYPVNFFLGESVPDRDIAFILALLYKSAELVVRNTGKLDKKIIELTGEKVHGFGDAETKIAEYHSKGLS